MNVPKDTELHWAAPYVNTAIYILGACALVFLISGIASKIKSGVESAIASGNPGIIFYHDLVRKLLP